MTTKRLTPDERHALARAPLPSINHYGGTTWKGVTYERLFTRQTNHALSRRVISQWAREGLFHAEEDL